MKNISKIVIFLLIIISTFIHSNLFCQQKPDKILGDGTKTVPDSTSQKKKREVLHPILISKLLGENLYENVLSKNFFETNDYRYAADFFTTVPFGFVRDLGSLGQPYEVLIYGNGFGNSSFLLNGISLNDRLSNSYDLNHFQAESIGSIEFVPLSMGFLFGSANNPVSVNFIPRQPGLQKPYSRIKFYQAPNGEGFIDGIFCITPFQKINTYFEITNQAVNPNYTNSDFSNWIGSVKMDYLLSKEVNILADYRYFKTIPQLNGGVDINTITQNFPASQATSILYDNIQAPVKFTNRYEKSSGHNLNIHLLGNLMQNSYTDITLYYQSYLTEFRQNEGQSNYQNNATSIIDDNKAKTLGFNFRHDLSLEQYQLNILANYESNTYISPLLKNEINKNTFSLAGIASTKLIDSTFEPTVFAKYLNDASNAFLGLGVHGAVLLDNNIKLNAGYSSFEKPYSIFEESYLLPELKLEKQKLSVLEFNGEYSSKLIDAKLGFFNQTAANSLISALENDSLKSDRSIYFSSKNISLQGINLNLNFKIWKILCYTNTSYYFNSQNRQEYKVPEFTLNGGVYYIDTLFEKNLKLKTGINYYSVGSQNYSIIDFEKSITSVYSWDPYNKSISLISEGLTTTSFQIDFFLAGKIRNAATVYIVFQNLLNNQYYITPYYPKQDRGLRFGVAWEFSD